MLSPEELGVLHEASRQGIKAIKETSARLRLERPGPFADGYRQAMTDLSVEIVRYMQANPVVPAEVPKVAADDLPF